MKKNSHLSANAYLYLKEKEKINERNSKYWESSLKDKDTQRGLKLAFIFLILAGAFALVIISASVSYLLLA